MAPKEPTSLFRAVNVSHRQMRCRHIVVATSHPSSDWNSSWYCSAPCAQDRDVATVTIIYSFLVGTLPLHARITSRVALTVRALNREDVRQFRNSKSVARRHRREQLNQFRFTSGTNYLYFNAPYVCGTAGGETQPDFLFAHPLDKIVLCDMLAVSTHLRRGNCTVCFRGATKHYIVFQHGFCVTQRAI